MQWHRHDDVEPATLQPRIIQGFDKPVGDRMPQVNLVPVLEVVDNLSHDAAAAIGGDSGLKMEVAVRAVRAGKCLRDLAGKGLGAGGAEGCLDPRRFAGTSRAEVISALDWLRANRA